MTLLLYPIPAELANQIAGIDKLEGLVEMKEGQWTAYFLPRKEGEVVLDHAEEYVEIHPEARYTSELTITGTELETLMSDPQTKKELLDANADGDWDKIREIRRRNLN